MPLKKAALAALIACPAPGQRPVHRHALRRGRHQRRVRQPCRRDSSAANGFNPGASNSVYRMDSGGLSGSRWGLRGTEDLGNGPKGVFVLESGFNLDTGICRAAACSAARPTSACRPRSARSASAASTPRCSRPWPTSHRPPTRPSTNPSCCSPAPTSARTTPSSTPASSAPSPPSLHFSFGTGLAPPQTGASAIAVGGNGEVPGAFRRDSASWRRRHLYGRSLGIALGYDQWNPTIGTGSGTFRKAAVAASYTFGPAKVMGGYRWDRTRTPPAPVSPATILLSAPTTIIPRHWA